MLAAAAGKPSRGTVAFHYAAVFDQQALAWYTRFDVLVVGAILGQDETRRLRSAGPSKLVAYEWSSGFYAGDPVSSPIDWQERVKANGWGLNVEPATGGAAEGGRGAIWYDYNNPELRRERARNLAGRIDLAGYDGIFLDTLGFEQLPPPMRQAYAKRYPAGDYNKGQGQFLAELRRLLPRKILFLNQGFRQAALFLPHADFDLTESYMTGADNEGGTRFRPWDDSKLPWEAVKTPLEQLILPAARRYPKVRFVHVNYAAGSAAVIRRAAWYSYACAKLFGHEAYLVAPAAFALEESDCYFRALGKPLEPTYRETGRQVTRRFEGGTVGIEGLRGFVTD